jgi:hypothetical protein
MVMASSGDSDVWTTVGLGVISVIGGLSKCAQWRDTKTGKFSIPAMIAGISACLILASCVKWLGDAKGVSEWGQMVISGVLCYVGPDPIIRGVAAMALKQIGVKEGPNGPDDK